MALRFQDNQGIQALDPNQIIELINGNSVVSGCNVTDGTNALEADISSGTVLVGGSEVSVSSQTVTLDSGDTDNPRKDIIYIDNTGTAQVAKGTPEDPEPEGAQRFDLFQPAPPSRDNLDGAVVAEIFVGANASDFGTSDIRDRRLFASAYFDSLNIFSTLDLNSNVIGNVGDPTNAQDAATKNYVDSEVTDSQLDVQDDGTSVLADAETLNFKNSHFDATDDGNSVAGIDITSNSLENSLLVNSSVTFAGQTASLGGSVSISIDNLSDVASSTESAGQLPIWNATTTQYENAALTGGNAISVANGDASVTLSVPTDGIGTDELDESAAYNFSSQIDFTGSIGGNASDITLADGLVTTDYTGNLQAGTGLGIFGNSHFQNELWIGQESTAISRFVSTSSGYFIQVGANNTGGSQADLIFTNINNDTEWMKIDVSEPNLDLSVDLNLSSSNIEMNGNNLSNVGQISGNNAQILVDNEINMNSIDDDNSNLIEFRNTNFGSGAYIGYINDRYTIQTTTDGTNYVDRISVTNTATKATISFHDNLIADPSNNTTADSMTANPETDAEDGYIEVEIDGTTRQIPFYNQ